MRDHSSVTLSTKMAENSEPVKRARKSNFTAAECTLLLTVAEENINIIKSKFTNAITNKNKNKVWEEITDQVNSLGVCKRSVTEIKEKWRGLVSSAKRVHSKTATDRQKTGGGSKPISPKGETIKIIIIIDLHGEDPSFSRITGGIAWPSAIHNMTATISEVATAQKRKRPSSSIRDKIDEMHLQVL